VNAAERAGIETALSTARATVATLEALLKAQTANDAPAAAPQPQTTPVAPAGSAGLQNAPAFYDHLRNAKLLGERIEPSEFAGCEAILAACAGKLPRSWTAYALATAFHETAGTMQPIKEYGSTAYFTRMYDIRGERPAKARELGNLQPGDGARYAGRGYVQLTGRTNYARATKELRAKGLDVDLVANPDDAMRPDVAAAVMVRGLMEGWFSGKSLNDYIPAEAAKRHYENARRIINGTDRAEMIAGYAMTFDAALKAGNWR
jgi:putative chitinase